MATLGSGGLGMGIVFALDDKFTQVSKKIRAEQERLFAGTTKLSEGASKAFAAANQKIFLGSVAVLAPLGAFLKMSAELSDQLANVQKTTGLTDKELGNLRGTLEGFDTRTSMADLLEIGTVAGRLGIAKDELEGFIKSADRAVVALGDDFSGGAEQVATQLGKLNNVFKDLNGVKVDVALTKIGSALNELGNAGANTAPSVANFAQRVGQLGVLAPTLSQTLGLGAALEELGLRADIASGGISNILSVAGENQAAFAKQMGLTTQAFRDMLDTNPNEIIKQFAQSFKGVKSSTVIPTLKALKVGSDESRKVVLALAGNLGLLERRQTLAAKAMKEGTSLTNEYNIKNNTLQASIDKLIKRLTILAQRIGDAVAPIFGFLALIVGAVTNAFIVLMKSPLGKFLVQLTTIIALGTAAFTFYLLAIVPVTGALRGLALQAAATWASFAPALIIAVPFIVLIDVIRRSIQAFKSFTGIVGTGFTLFLQRVGGLIAGITAIATSWDNVTETFLLSKGLAQKLEQLGILNFVVSLGTWIVRLMELFKGLWQGIKSVFALMARVAKSIMGFFTPILNVFTFLLDLVGKNTTEVKLWAEAGKLAGIVIGIALVAITAHFVLLGAVALISMMPIIAVMTLIGLTIFGVIKIAQFLINKFQEIWAQSTGFFDFGKNLVLAIWNGVKSMWGSFTGWLSNAMKNIPVVGRFFQDEEATTTLNQQINTSNTNDSLGSSIAAQQGLLSLPQPQQAGAGVLQNQPTQQINLLIDGNQVATVVNDNNTLSQARD